MITFFFAQGCRCVLRFHGSGGTRLHFLDEFALFWRAAAVTCCSGRNISHMTGWFQVLLLSSGVTINHDIPYAQVGQ